MANILYITANPYDETTSYSMAVGREFIEAYKKLNPEDNIVHLDLYEAEIPYLDRDVFNGWEKLKAGTPFEKLSHSERLKTGRLAELGGQFLLADKYVFVNPMWNFSIPAVMKTYIDAVTVSGKTFKYTKEGSVGLLKGKKAFHIQSSGDIYSYGSEAKNEMSNRYLEVMMNFFEVSSFESIIIEGQQRFPEKAEEIKAKALFQAQEAAAKF
ncbi:FMN-dependent NADH-azoreductase [Niallia taxi]|uniref:FMN-dependent NADH-azoreductase n=1 Tax=Niallia taxi TaxID=2499688 RepID=UPI002E1B108F|nr:FMN-dependent NADH-azoreductase [Niallia taxi]MED4121800.1 FMN-dependent NADH-azoreductase [Niallia taxi]